MTNSFWKSLVRGKRLITFSFLLAIIVGFLLPIFFLVIRSFSLKWFWPSQLPQAWTVRWYSWVVVVFDVKKQLFNSLVVATLTTFLTLAISFPAGYAFGRYRFKGKSMLEVFLFLPMLMPTIILAVPLAKLFYEFRLIDNYLGTVLAHTVIAIPYGVRLMASAFESLGKGYEEAAQTCGATRIQTSGRVILPMLVPSLAASVIYIFTLSMDEFVLALLTTGPRTQTLPVRIFTVIGEGFTEVAAAVSVILMSVTFLLLLLGNRVLKTETISGIGL